jgi:hypothetical protein
MIAHWIERPSLRPWQRQVSLHLLALLVFLLLTGLALNNLILHFWVAVPDDGIHHDYAIFCWDLWWMRFSLLELGTSPLETDYMVYPFTHSLALHTLVPFWGVLSIPLQPFMEVNAILNVFIVVSFVLTGYLTFVFVRRQGSAWSLAVVAGVMVAFTPAMVRRAAHAHLSMLPMWWVPLSLLACDWVFSSRSFWPALALGLCAYMGVLVDLQYVVWVPMVLVPYGVSRLLSGEVRSDKDYFRRVLVRLSVAAAVWAGLLLLYPFSQTLGLDTAEYSQDTLNAAQNYSFRLSAFVRYWESDSNIGLLITPLAILTGILGKARKGGWVWVLLAAGSLVLAFGPYLTLEPYTDAVRVPMPYLLLHNLLGGQYRAPVRFACLAVFGLTILIATKGQAAFERFRVSPSLRFALAGVLLILVIADYRLYRPFPISIPKKYDAYNQLAQDPEDIVLLEVPLGVDRGYTMYGYAQQLIYYQPVHEKRIPSGAISRMPREAVDLFRSVNLLEAIAGRAPLEPAAADELPRLIDEWNIGYVFVHRDLLSQMLNQEYLQDLLPFFATHPSLCFGQVEYDLVTFQARPPEGCPPMEVPVRVNLGMPDDVAHVGSGWYPPEDIGAVRGRWAGGESVTTLRFDLSAQSYQLRFRALAYPSGQVVIVRVNDHIIAELPMAEDWIDYQVAIPASVIEAGEPTYVQFEHAVLLSAHERTQGESPDQRPLGAAYEWVVIEP